MTTPTTVTCAGCGHDNPAAARFCMGCGSSLEVPCSSCDTALPPGAKFCFNCGAEIVAGATDADAGQSAMAVTDQIAAKLREITADTGERRTITMMFCDVKDSTATAEMMDPEAWSDIMHRAMDCFVSSVERYGGTVARLLGDAILAYFGAPVAHEDDPQRALLAGLDILRCSATLCDEVQERYGTNFSVRIGVNTGLVVVGEMGSEQRSEYAALGDAANVAARMEQTAEPGTMRIAGATHKLVAPLFDLEPVGTIEVKGRREPVDAYTVLAARGTPGQVRGIEGLSSPLVGRDHELEQLTGALRAVSDGSGRIVSLLGEAGLGKSRLVAELRGTLEDRDDVHWITGTCHSYLDTTPYAPFAVALRDCLEVDTSQPTTAQTTHVIDTVTAVLGHDARPQALYLCTLLGLPLAPDDQQELAFLDPGSLRQRVFDAVTELFEALARRSPVVLELEDLHWADPTSLDLAEQLLALTESAPLLVLALFRPRRDEGSWRVHETAMRDHAHRHVTVSLHALGDDDAQSLVANLLRVEGLSERVRDTILTKSEGNPFFVEEVIRSLLDDGTIVREGERFVATRDIATIAVPDTLTAVLSTRLDRLPPATRSVVQTAAVLGRDFTVELLRLLTGPEVALDDIVTDLQRRELLVEARRDGEALLSFKHALTRDTAYDTLLRSVRRDVHRLVGDVIEEHDPDHVFDLARHFAEAEEPSRAVPYLVEAGERSFAAFAREDAADYFRRALSMWDAGMELEHARRAYEGLGNTLMYLGDMAGSVRTFDEMLAFSREHADPLGEVSALNKGGFVTLVGIGDAAAAEEKLLQAKSIAEANENRVGVAEFHVGFCYLNVSLGKLDRAERFLGEAAEVCFSLDSHYRNFGLLHYAESLIYQVRFDEARPALQRAIDQAEADGDYDHLPGGQAAFAEIDFFTGDPTSGRTRAEEALELAMRFGATMSACMASWVAGMCAFQLGDLEAARTHLDRCIELAVASGLFFHASESEVGLAAITQWVDGTTTDAAMEHLDRAREHAQVPVSQAAASTIWSGIGVELLRRGDLDGAHEALRVAAETPSARSKLSQPEILVCDGFVALGRGDVDSARALFHDAIDLIDRTGLGLFRPRALLGAAVVAGQQGEHDRMVELLAAAEDDAVGRAQRLDTITVQRTAADLLDRAGLRTQAELVRERLGDSVAEVAARISDNELRRRFLRSNALLV